MKLLSCAFAPFKIPIRQINVKGTKELSARLFIYYSMIQ